LNRNPSAQTNWNAVINSHLLKQNDQHEQTKLYNITRSYFIWFFSGDEDLLHEFYINVLNTITNYNPALPLHNWLVTLAHRQRLKSLQTKAKQKKRQTSLNRIPEPIDLETDALTLEVDDWLNNYQLMDLVHEVMELHLTQNERRFFLNYDAKKQRSSKNRYYRLLKLIRSKIYV
jgi:DNA-directed RNA polymerase specialized sigma24 family protein